MAISIVAERKQFVSIDRERKASVFLEQIWNQIASEKTEGLIYFPFRAETETSS